MTPVVGPPHCVTVPPPRTPDRVGGRISAFASNWVGLGSVLAARIAKEGYKLNLRVIPQLTTNPQFQRVSAEKVVIWNDIVAELLSKGAIERVLNVNSPGMYSHMLLRPNHAASNVLSSTSEHSTNV